MYDSDMQDRFDDLCAKMAPAQHKCNQTYIAWQEACREWKDLVRERNEIWGQILQDSVTGALPERSKSL